MKTAYFDCASGISGDMIIGSFIGAGLKLSALRKELAKLKLGGYTLKASTVMRKGVAATRFECLLSKNASRKIPHRTLRSILSMIRASSLPERVKENAKKVFTTLGEAESKAHRVPLANVHFHELGCVDSIVDIVGACIALDLLGIDRIFSSAITVSRAAPATARLLEGVTARFEDCGFETATPTGVAILGALSDRPCGPVEFEPESTGFGAGSNDPSCRPNILKVMIGGRTRRFLTDEVTVMETNIDDLNPQVFEYLYEKLFASGALDVFVTPIQMKKSRPAFKLTVLVDDRNARKAQAVIFSETSTIGVRMYKAGRIKLDRKAVTIRTRYGTVRGKKIFRPEGPTVIPEYDDCVKIAKKRKIPFKKIYDEAVLHGAG